MRPNGISLAVEHLGPDDGPLVLQLEGHMAQRIATPASYCAHLTGLGMHVVRVDNRDVGESPRCADAPDYSLHDMVADVHDLLERLGRGPAIVCGRSMGGAVAQLLALTHPRDVAGLGLFFTWAKDVPAEDPAPVGPAPFADEESFVAWEQAALPAIAGPAHPFGRAEIDDLARSMWHRGVSWEGFERQRRAIARTDPWATRLGEIDVPTSIVHGADDRVIPLAASRALHAGIRGSRLHVVPGLGHQQPATLDDLFVAATLEAATSVGPDGSPG